MNMSSIAVTVSRQFPSSSMLRSLTTTTTLRSISSLSSSSSFSTSSSHLSSFSSRSFLSSRFFSTDSNATPSADASKTNPEQKTSETPKDPAVLAAEYEKLKAEHEKLKVEAAKSAETLDSVRRAAAEVDNARKRAMEEAKKERLYAIQGFAKQLLDVADTLEIALKESQKQQATESENFKNMVMGIEMTLNNLTKAFDKGGVKKMNPLGEVYDPNKYEVIVSIPTADKPHNTVIEVFKSGYMLNDRCLRAAQVATAKKP